MKRYFCSLVFIAVFLATGNYGYSQNEYGHCIATFSYHSKLVSSVSFSPDNSKLYTCSFDGSIYEFDLMSFTETLFKKGTKVWDMKCSNVNDFIVVTFADWNYHIYNRFNKRLIKYTWGSSIMPDVNSVRKCAISKDGIFVALSMNGGASVLKYNNTTFTNFSNIGINSSIRSMLFSSDNYYLILGDKDGVVHIVDLETRKTVLKLNEAQNQNNEISALAINSDGNRIIIGDSRGVIRIYRFLVHGSNVDVKMMGAITAHNDKINAINFVNDKLLATASSDGLIKFWDDEGIEKTGNPIAIYDNFDAVSCMSVSSDGDYLACGSNNGVVKIWDISGGVIIVKHKPQADNYTLQSDDSNIDVKNDNNKLFDISNLLFETPVAETENEVVKPEPKVNNQQTTTQYSIKPIISETENEVIEPEPKVNNQQTITQNITTPVSIVNKNIENEVDSIMFFEQNSKKNTFVLIIGNEDYSKSQTTAKTEINVPFAINDADVFKTYCIKLLGIPENQIIILKDGTSAQMKRSISKLKDFSQIENGNAELIFYYSGHGLPNEQTKEPFLIPVDVNGADLTDAISLSFLYKSLTEYPTQRITVFLDACFSGGARNMPLVAQKSMTINPEKIELNGKIVVFASSRGTESSGVYEEKKHGYFTYFLLKKLKDTKGDVNYKELSDYLEYEVSKQSLIDDKKQTPILNFSPEIQNDWGAYKLK